MDVYHRPGAAAGSYGGLQHCGSVWVCAVCGAKIVEHRRDELARAFDLLNGQGGAWALVSATFSHGPSDAFADLDERLAAALHHFRNSRAWKSLKPRGLMGTIRAYEVTWGPVNGWHPHVHLLLAFGSPTVPEGLQALLLATWRAALATVGLRCSDANGLDVRLARSGVAAYVAKWGVEPAGRPWGVEDEVTRGVSKSARSGARYTPPDLLRLYRDTGDVEPRARYREYAAATKGRSQLRWSPGLRLLLLGDEGPTDDEIAGGVEDGSALLGQLSPAEWGVILAADRRGELLEAAARGWDAALAYVAALVGVAA